MKYVSLGLCVCSLVSLSVWKRSLTLLYSLLDRVGSKVEPDSKVASNLTFHQNLVSIIICEDNFHFHTSLSLSQFHCA